MVLNIGLTGPLGNTHLIERRKTMKRIVLVALIAAVLGSVPATSWAVGFTGGGGASGGLASTDIDTCAELAAILTDETGTCGSVVLSQAPTIVSPIVTTSLNIPHSTSLPGTCSVGDQYMDTDATTGQRLYLCESANTWALQGDGGAGTGMTHGETMVRISLGF